jgi:hemolysin D
LNGFSGRCLRRENRKRCEDEKWGQICFWKIDLSPFFLSVIVKIETFNFTKYGYVEGVVTQVSHDAVTDKERGLIYTAHIQLEKDRMLIDGNEVKLAPGMAITAEVKMGKRRVIEFLLSPLLRYQQESGRER